MRPSKSEPSQSPARHRPAVRRKRRIDYPRHGRSGARRWIPSWRLLLGGAVACLGALAGLTVIAFITIDVPGGHAEARREANVYYWADGSQMVSVGPVNRQTVPLDKVPGPVRDAVIAAENESFYSDSGVSFTGLARAAFNMVRGQETQGGSTITQQYVKNTYLSQDQTVTRKVREFVISVKLDREQSKDSILEGYLNSSWFGRGAHGIQAAARAYYGIDAEELDPSQGAFLAAVLKGADRYDPALSRGNHERAEERWEWILDREVEAGLMSEAERDGYRKFPEPRKESRSTRLDGQTGYLVDLADRDIFKRAGLSERDLARGGYRIHTTFERDKVERLERSVKDVLERDLDPDKREADRYVQVGAASVRPGDGAVVAVYGGADATEHFANNADTTGVPAGSTFKPFVLAAALHNGVRPKGERGPALPVTTSTLHLGGGYYGEKPEPTPPYSWAGTLDARPYPPVTAPGPTLGDALVRSAKATFVQLGKDVGLDRVKDFAVGSGMLEGSMADREQTFPLGTSTPSAIRTADAYATFASGGVRVDPYSVTRVTRKGKQVGGLDKPRPHRAMKAEVADEMTRILESAVLKSEALVDRAAPSGEPVASALLGGRVAGYGTGRNDWLKSAWFTGYTEELSTAVTMFRSKPGEPRLRSMDGVGGEDSLRGSTLPPRIWSAYMTGGAQQG